MFRGRLERRVQHLPVQSHVIPIRGALTTKYQVNIHCRTRARIPIEVRISVPETGTVTIEDPDLEGNPSQSLCNGNSSCTVQCSHPVRSLNSSPCPAMSDWRATKLSSEYNKSGLLATLAWMLIY